MQNPSLRGYLSMLVKATLQLSDGSFAQHALSVPTQFAHLRTAASLALLIFHLTPQRELG